MNSSRAFGKSIARLPLGLQLLLAANLLYCLIAATTPALPGWKMFSRVGPQKAALIGAGGVRVDLKDFLPRESYALTQADFERVGCFAARRRFPGEICRLVTAAGEKRLKASEGSCDVLD